MSDPVAALTNQQLTLSVRRIGSALQRISGQILMMERTLCALDAREKLRDAGRTPVYPVEFRSQFGEDCIAWRLLGGQLDGFFIEVGAFDGYAFSVSYALECVGWRGLLIEAIPQRAEACAQRRKRSRVVHAALGKDGSSGTTQFTVVDDHWGGMLSYHTTDQEHRDAIARNRQVSTSVTVPITSLNALLADHEGAIDFASIDVEGGEIELLEGFDLRKHRPRLMIIEDKTRRDNSPIQLWMAQMPYTFLGWAEVNRIYARSDCQDILDRARGL